MNGIECSRSFGRVILAIVPATAFYMAAALGAAAFSLQDNFVDEPTVIDSDVKPVYDFEAVPAKSLSREWGGRLPAAVRRDTDIGHQLLATALAKTRDSREQTPYLYDEEGHPIFGRDELKAFTQFDVDAEKPHWLVPGIVRRYTVHVPDGPSAQLPCDCRSLTTPHIYIGRDGAPQDYSELDRPIWICRSCGRPTYGPDPVEGDDEANQDISSVAFSDQDRSLVEVSIPDGPAAEHERQITAYHNEYGQYPWTDRCNR